MFPENPEQVLQVETVVCRGSIFEVEPLTSNRPEWFGNGLPIARIDYIISHAEPLSLGQTIMLPSQNGRKTCRIDIESRTRF